MTLRNSHQTIAKGDNSNQVHETNYDTQTVSSPTPRLLSKSRGVRDSLQNVLSLSASFNQDNND